MTEKIMFRAGEATVEAAPGQFTGAITEVLIGQTAGPVGFAFAQMLGRNVGFIYSEPGLTFTSFDHMMGQAKGYTRMFGILACNYMVRPSTLVISKASLRNKLFEELYGGVVQPAVSDAVLDSVIENVIPHELVSSLCCITLAWLDPACSSDRNLDKKELYQNNYQATKLAIKRAMHDEPSLEELIAYREKNRHEFSG